MAHWKNVAISVNFWAISEILTDLRSASDSGSDEHFKTIVASIFPTRTISSKFYVTDMIRLLFFPPNFYSWTLAQKMENFTMRPTFGTGGCDIGTDLTENAFETTQFLDRNLIFKAMTLEWVDSFSYLLKVTHSIQHWASHFLKRVTCHTLCQCL